MNCYAGYSVLSSPTETQWNSSKSSLLKNRSYAKLTNKCIRIKHGEINNV